MKAKVWKLLSLLSITIFLLSAAATVHAQAVTATITIGSSIAGFEYENNIDVAYDSNTHQIFVSDPYMDVIHVISDSTNTVVSNLTAVTPNEGYFGTMAYDSGKSEMWIAMQAGLLGISDSTYEVVSNVTGFPSESANYYVTYDSGKGELFTTYGTNTIQVVSDSTNTIIANITVPEMGPLVYDSGKGEVFALVYNESSSYLVGVAVISDKTNSIVTTVPTTLPAELVYDSGKGEIFVQEATSTLIAISDSTNKIVATIPNVSAGSMAYDSRKGEIYVNQGSSVQIISDSTNKIVGTVNTGFTSPKGIAYDSGTSEIFAANAGEPNTLAVISDSSSVTSSPTATATSTTSTSTTASPTPRIPEFSSPAFALIATAIAIVTLSAVVLARKRQRVNNHK